MPLLLAQGLRKPAATSASLSRYELGQRVCRAGMRSTAPLAKRQPGDRCRGRPSVPYGAYARRDRVCSESTSSKLAALSRSPSGSRDKRRDRTSAFRERNRQLDMTSARSQGRLRAARSQRRRLDRSGSGQRVIAWPRQRSLVSRSVLMSGRRLSTSRSAFPVCADMRALTLRRASR